MDVLGNDCTHLNILIPVLIPVPNLSYVQDIPSGCLFIHLAFEIQ